MSSTDRQNRLLVTEDWKKIYQSFRNADFKNYDFDNLRRTMINYLRQNYPEDFNDYIESSEYLALIDMIAFLGQNLSFRIDLNARENFLETAERRESVLRLARLISYNPSRNRPANGLLKLETIKTTETIFDSTGLNLSGITVKWNDRSNNNYFEQFVKIFNSALPDGESIGNPVRAENIAGVVTEQYKINGLNTDYPVFNFTKVIEGTSTKFELVSTAIHNGQIVEEPPLPGNNPSFLFRDDGQGAGSNNTGFFMHFRQGSLQAGEFSINNPVPNQAIAIDTVNINNDDIWLYGLDSNNTEKTLWSKLAAVEGNNIIYNSLFNNVRDVYTVTTRINDRINLVFSDGVFGNLPSGNFRVYYRTSNGRSITITPNEIGSVQVEIPYQSKNGTSEILTLSFRLKYNVSNSVPSESNTDIKLRAPSTYYTQNRLITAEDYNVGPLGINQNIIKVKAVNRVSSGISRYFDLKDTSGKYSNTSIFADDGILYRDEYTTKSKFDFNTQADVEGVIYNTIEPIIASDTVQNFYLSKFPKIIVTDLNAVWNSTTTMTNRSTGYLKDQEGTSFTIGSFTDNNLKLIEPGSMLKFSAPDGYHFMDDNSLMAGAPDHLNSKTYVWTKVIRVIESGTEVQADGSGPVILNDIIPEGAILTQVLPKFATSLTDSLKVQIIDRAFNYRDFALRYDVNERLWKLITADNINTLNDFSTGKAGDTSGQNLDASWLLYFKTDGQTYQITYRNLRYIFESENEVRFFFDSADKVYDPKTGQIVKDAIKILNINRKPDSLEPLTIDYRWSITDAYRDKEGYVDSKKIQVKFFDFDDDGVADDPDIFDVLVDPLTNIGEKYIFEKKYKTTDNVEDYKFFNNSNNTILVLNTETQLAPRSSYVDGQIFYFYEQDVFKYLDSTTGNLITTSDYRAFIGRSGLKFHYIHVADSNYRIDPAVSNIIDLYVLSKNYDTNYRNYLKGTTATKPLPPSQDELFYSYGPDLYSIKSISDEVIFHPVRYKPLFGPKAREDLQVTFKVVKNKDLVINNNQVKADVIEAINNYFAIENWSFGDTFYFQELAAYIIAKLSPSIVSIVIVPKQADQGFGSLFQIKSEPDEIFVNSAGVGDIEIIDDITASNLQASGKVITSSVDNSTGIKSSPSTTSNSTVSLLTAGSSTLSDTGGYSY
jgi:hypothetical protein